MDRHRWKRWVPNLSWPCPTCQAGQLRLSRDTFHSVESRAERLEQDDPSANHHDRTSRFVALMKCDHRLCGETATVTGNHNTHWMPDGSEDGYTDEGYEVLSLVPSPLPFPIAKGVPKPIEAIVREACSLFWLDHKAAANRAREAIEAILTDHGVPTRGPKGNPLWLHDRILLFAKLEDGKWAEQAEIIEAAKHIGNEGTHATIDRETALDAFEMLETVIDDIYVRRRHTVLAKARSTNARHRKA